MKKIFLTIAILFLLVNVFSQEKGENATHYIEGTYKAEMINGRMKFKLFDISAKGILFNSVDTIRGEKTEEGYQLFQFNEVSTTYPKGFDGGLKFWRWDTNLKKWQIDSEVVDAQPNFNSTKKMTVMLVLDCSSSMSSDFEKLKLSAKKFINIFYNKSPNGNVLMGIVGFNSMKNTNKMIFPITELNSTSKLHMESFINRLEMGNNTAYYYAMRKACDMMFDKTSSLHFSSDKNSFSDAIIVSFTDGYDNQSYDEMLGLPADGLDNPYLKYVKNVSLQKRLNTIGRNENKKIESYVISMKGSDVGDNKKFEDVLCAVASKGKFYPSANIKEVERRFEEIATNLMNRWQDLDCYVPPAFQGRVRWTLGEAKEKQKSSFMFGINAGMGGTFIPNKLKAFVGSFGVDFGGFFKNKPFGMGGYFTYNYAPFAEISFGPSFYFGNKDKTSVLLGVGFAYAIPYGWLDNNEVERIRYYRDYDKVFLYDEPVNDYQSFYRYFEALAFNVKLGLNHRGFYYFLNASMGGCRYFREEVYKNDHYYYSYSRPAYYNVTFNIGYMFGNKKDKQKQEK